MVSHRCLQTAQQAHQTKQALPLLQCALPEEGLGKWYLWKRMVCKLPWGMGKKPLKRPASALEKAVKRPASALEKVEKAKPNKEAGKKKEKNHAKTSLEKEKRKPWLKIKKTVGKKNPRAYLTGTTEKGGKLKLIVEVSGARCPDWYSQMIDEIWTSLEKEALTKSEARDLREELCKKWGANW